MNGLVLACLLLIDSPFSNPTAAAKAIAEGDPAANEALGNEAIAQPGGRRRLDLQLLGETPDSDPTTLAVQHDECPELLQRDVIVDRGDRTRSHRDQRPRGQQDGIGHRVEFGTSAMGHERLRTHFDTTTVRLST